VLRAAGASTQSTRISRGAGATSSRLAAGLWDPKEGQQLVAGLKAGDTVVHSQV
jgi:hypothetical protein